MNGIVASIGYILSKLMRMRKIRRDQLVCACMLLLNTVKGHTQCNWILRWIDSFISVNRLHFGDGRTKANETPLS